MTNDWKESARVVEHPVRVEWLSSETNVGACYVNLIFDLFKDGRLVSNLDLERANKSQRANVFIRL